VSRRKAKSRAAERGQTLDVANHVVLRLQGAGYVVLATGALLTQAHRVQIRILLVAEKTTNEHPRSIFREGWRK
jgi:hypothetical protein